jgi:hypothetical protein
MLGVKSPILFLAAISAGALSFGTAASASTPAGNANVAKTDQPGLIAHPNPSLPLRKGMIARDVKARWGEPASVTPFSSADGKAEVWTYYYTVSDQTTQVVTGTVDQMTYCGPTQGMGMHNTPQLVYGLKRIEVKQVVKLLLYDGTLVSWKKAIERSERPE